MDGHEDPIAVTEVKAAGVALVNKVWAVGVMSRLLVDKMVTLSLTVCPDVFKDILGPE